MSGVRVEREMDEDAQNKGVSINSEARSYPTEVIDPARFFFRFSHIIASLISWISEHLFEWVQEHHTCAYDRVRLYLRQADISRIHFSFFKTVLLHIAMVLRTASLITYGKSWGLCLLS